jgi:hypothetical protein
MAIVKKAQQAIGHALNRSEGPMQVAEKYAAAYAFGFVKGYYRERASYRGVPADLIAGIAGVAGAAVLEVMSSGRSNLAPHLSAIGDAGVMSYLGSMGASMGAKRSGRQVYVLNAGAARPGALPAGLTAVGELPQAVGGAYLSADDIARFSAQR